MTLERVSFKKPRDHAPRLSEPYVPGQHSARFFAEWELQVLRDHYEKDGPAACLAKLPHRNLGSIYRKANALGLRNAYPGTRARHHKTAELDAKIRQRWPELKGRGAVIAFAEELGKPRWWVSRRARDLGIATVPHKKEPPWTPAELALLRQVPLHDADRAADIFRANGFRRTPTSIIVKSKRQQISRISQDAMSAHRVAAILGIDDKTAAGYCLDGSLPATRRGSKRLPQQGGDTWVVTRSALRQFILDNIERLDIRKVDKFTFVELLANAAPAGHHVVLSEDDGASLFGLYRGDDLVFCIPTEKLQRFVEKETGECPDFEAVR